MSIIHFVPTLVLRSAKKILSYIHHVFSSNKALFNMYAIMGNPLKK